RTQIQQEQKKFGQWCSLINIYLTNADNPRLTPTNRNAYREHAKSAWQRSKTLCPLVFEVFKESFHQLSEKS
ncbi:MAG: hypothetical protein VKJ06_04830, partial [Vampirovibrionales bacterium]|nr:hypothetical protein [Vampirovibrionales bacterium]